VTSGTVLRAVSSSPIGNIKAYLLLLWLDLSQLDVKMCLEFFKEGDLLAINHLAAASGKRPTVEFSGLRGAKA